MHSRLDTVLHTVVQLAYANLLWVVFVLAGGVVLGLAPATVAVVEHCRGFPGRPPDVAVRSFAASWSRSFVRANLCAGAVASLTVSGAVYLVRSVEVAGPLGVSLRLGLALVIALCLVGVVHVLVLVAFRPESSLRDQLCLGLVTGMVRPVTTILMLGVVLLDALLLLRLPAVFVVFGASLPLACLAALSRDALSTVGEGASPRDRLGRGR